MAGLWFLCVAITAYAEPAKKLVIDIDDCPPEVEKVQAVQDGDDQRLIGLLHTAKPCEWSRELEFSTNLASFSLRLSGNRTECVHTVPRKEEQIWIGYARFKGGAALPGRVVRIEVQPPQLSVSYLRQLREHLPGIDSGRRCVEWGILSPDGAIDHVNFGMETIHLQLGAESPDVLAVGLHVNDLLPRALKAGYVPLTLDGVVHRLLVQRAEDGNLSSNAIDLDEVKFKDVGLEKVEVWVK